MDDKELIELLSRMDCETVEMSKLSTISHTEIERSFREKNEIDGSSKNTLERNIRIMEVKIENIQNDINKIKNHL